MLLHRGVVAIATSLLLCEGLLHSTLMRLSALPLCREVLADNIVMMFECFLVGVNLRLKSFKMFLETLLKLSKVFVQHLVILVLPFALLGHISKACLQVILHLVVRSVQRHVSADGLLHGVVDAVEAVLHGRQIRHSRLAFFFDLRMCELQVLLLLGGDVAHQPLDGLEALLEFHTLLRHDFLLLGRPRRSLLLDVLQSA
mmetsp:Transcript_79819/g.258640  ORF Transcript_79819/g.258640 Transcript_79819/m.258640 type:complete len:200 (+) Transcript_79819:1660-2259(+)